MIHEWQRDGDIISTDPARLDLDVIHGFLRGAYWCEEIPCEVVARALANSLAFGLYRAGQQIGLARVVTDYATFAYVADVFVLPDYRGQGLAKWLMATVVCHPDLQGLRRWTLATRDAHGLYAQVGFTPLAAPDRFMEISRPDIYRTGLSAEAPSE